MNGIPIRLDKEQNMQCFIKFILKQQNTLNYIIPHLKNMSRCVSFRTSTPLMTFKVHPVMGAGLALKLQR